MGVNSDDASELLVFAEVVLEELGGEGDPFLC